MEYVSLVEAAKLLPKINGKHPHPATLWRWTRHGIKGIRLDAKWIGGRWVTSKEAIEMFLRDTENPEGPASLV